MPQTQPTRARTRSPFASGPIAPTLGDWAILETLHAGRFSQVVRVIPRRCDVEGERGYVAKVAGGEGGASRRAANLIRRERDLLNGLDHPHLATVLDAGSDELPPYFVMPLLGDRTLADWIRFHQRLTLADVLWIARQVSEGVRYLHQMGLCHLDIKPENVVVSESGHATLIDLGFAQTIGVHKPTAPLVGSRQYVAPERFRHARIVAPAADIYSLGMILVGLLCGGPEPPDSDLGSCDGSSEPKTSPRLRRRRYILARHPGLSFPFIAFLESMIAHIPERRPDSETVLEQLWRLEIESFQI